MAFKVFDYDGSGKISIEEIVSTATALGRASDVNQIVSAVQSSGHQGELDFASFIEIFCLNATDHSENTHQQLFTIFDYNQTGAFGAEEFEKIALSVGENLSPAEVDQIVEYADLDKDGVISFE